ncbi:cation:proton antiporter [Ideonella sp.]|uniref:cation:proton antiporter n=1 Tax=Ideonella sp. TaxID=1929293 RepID=UPI0035B08A6E
MAEAIAWFLVAGGLLVLVGLTDTWRRELPFSAAAIYLVAGHLLGPEGVGFLDLSFERESDAALVERLTEVAVLISLFAVGLRLRAPLSDPLWRAPVVMATLTMAVTVGLVAALGWLAGLALAPALLLGAVLSPTDPVLASDVQVDHERDRDRLRFCLTAEGGMNDGTAFPMVMLALGMLGLHELGDGGLRWWGRDVLWAVAAGLAIGWAMGWAFSRAVVWLRREREQAMGMESFLTLGLIALAYGAALGAQAYGFLAVFAAGLAMRYVERQDTRDDVAAQEPAASAGSPQVADLGPADATVPARASAYMAKAVLDFTLDLEKLAELVVMVLIGALLSREAFTPTNVGIALGVCLLARPLAVWCTTPFLSLDRPQRRLAAWFGVRGVGSMYYLAFAVAHGASGPEVEPVIEAVLVTVAMSVLLHGATATPAMRRYRERRR